MECSSFSLAQKSDSDFLSSSSAEGAEVALGWCVALTSVELLSWFFSGVLFPLSFSLPFPFCRHSVVAELSGSTGLGPPSFFRGFFSADDRTAAGLELLELGVARAGLGCLNLHFAPDRHAPLTK